LKNNENIGSQMGHTKKIFKKKSWLTLLCFIKGAFSRSLNENGFAVTFSLSQSDPNEVTTLRNL
jgi:hypothetical protein